MTAAATTPPLLDSDKRLDLEILISEISSWLIHVKAGEFDAAVEECLQKILDFLRIDRAVLFLLEAPGSRRFVLSHMRIRPGCGPQVKPNLSTDSFPWMVVELLSGRETRYSRIDDLPDAASVDKETLRQYGPQYSALAVPLFDNGTVFGILTLGIARELIWPEDLPPRLRVVAHVFAGALIRRKTEEHLRRTLLELEQTRIKLEQENVYLRTEISGRFTRPGLSTRATRWEASLRALHRWRGAMRLCCCRAKRERGKK
jgi:GAF domain-containing protein